MSFVRFGFSRALEFRIDFLLRIVMDCFYYAANFLFFRTVLLHTPSVAGWTEAQMMIFVSTFIFCDAVVMTLFSDNNHAFAMLINQGQLDYLLVRPVEPLFIATTRSFAAASFGNFVIASGILGWAVASYPAPIALEHALAYGLALVLGIILWQGMAVLLIYVPAFWTHSVAGFTELNFALHRVAERPDGIYRGRWLRVLLTTLLPYAAMASFPARILFGDDPWHFLGRMAVAVVIVSLLVWGAWAKGLKAYASASS